MRNIGLGTSCSGEPLLDALHVLAARPVLPRVYVVASMLMSPLMGPIVASSFGLATFRRELFTHGWRNTIVLLVSEEKMLIGDAIS